jgi:hypothetical protein
VEICRKNNGEKLSEIISSEIRFHKIDPRQSEIGTYVSTVYLHI